MNGHHVRSLVSVLAGLTTIVLLSNGIDTVPEASGVVPSLAAQRNDGFDSPGCSRLRPLTAACSPRSEVT